MDSQRLKKLKQFYKKYRRLPSYSEMLSLFGLLSKNAIFKIIKNWIKDGFITKENHKLSPTGKFFELPMLGHVAAGFPTTTEEAIDFVSLDEYLVEKPTASFLLKVSGDSLKDIGILPGDIVVIERASQANQGDIVLALLDNEWTLKIFAKKDGQAVLNSANPKYRPFFPKFDLQITGIVRSVVRKIS